MAKIKVPKTIQIGGHVYDVFFCHAVRDDGDWGQVHHRLLNIGVHSHLQKESVKTEAFWHEVTHAINWIFCERELEEKQVAAIAQGLVQVMVQLGIQFDWGEIETREEFR